MAAPTFLATWVVVLILWLIPAACLLSTDVGRQGLVDERVRVAESFGQSVDDTRYAAWQASPPWLVYGTTGSRHLMLPPVTLLVAGLLMVLARADGRSLGATAAMAVVVHASVVLVVQQAVAAPLQYLRESITSPTNLAALLAVGDEGSVAARALGAVDVFGIWWIGLLALGVSAATGRPARRYLARLLAVYAGVAIMMAAVLAAAGGS